MLVGGRSAPEDEDGGERAHLVSVRRGAEGAVEMAPEGEGEGEEERERARYRVESLWRPGLDCFEGTVNGTPLAVQVERERHGFRLTHAGHSARYRVLTRRAAALRARMPVKRPPDLSRFLLSPCRGSWCGSRSGRATR